MEGSGGEGSDSEGASWGGHSELSEGEFACYTDAFAGDSGGDAGDSGGRSPRRPAETLSQGQLEEQRLRDTFLVSHVKEGLSFEAARELLIRHRWDVHKLLRDDEQLRDLRSLQLCAGGAGGAGGAGAGGETLCPVCQEALLVGEGEDANSELVTRFTGCAPPPGAPLDSPRAPVAAHGAHTECVAAYARVCIVDSTAGQHARPGTVPCPVCMAEGAGAPGGLTEAQVAALVPSELMDVYLKARARLRHAARRGAETTVAPRALFARS
jgi:hypothetical protein